METNFKLKLLPNYFKIIGWIVIISLLATLFVFKAIGFRFPEANSLFYKDIMMNGMILGIFIIAFSQEKIEDERTRDCRFKAMASALIFAVAFTIVYPPIDFFIFNDTYEVLKAQQVIPTTLLMYFFYFKMLINENYRRRKLRK